MACKSDNKCGMCGETLIEAPEQTVASTASIFMKFTVTQYLLWASVPNLYSNPTRNVENTGEDFVYAVT